MRSALLGLALALIVVATALGVLVPRAQREAKARDLLAQRDRCTERQDARSGAMQDDLYGLRRRLETACDASMAGNLSPDGAVQPYPALPEEDTDFLFIVALEDDAPRIVHAEHHESDPTRRYAPEAAQLAALARAFRGLTADGLPRDEPLERALWIADTGEQGAHVRVVASLAPRYSDRPQWAVVGGRVLASGAMTFSLQGAHTDVELEPPLRDASGAPAERAWLPRRDCWIPVPSTSPTNLELGIVAIGALAALAIGALAARRRAAS